MATLTLRKRETGTTEENPKEHKLLTNVKHRVASFLTELYGPPKTKRNRVDDELFTSQLDRWYPRG